VDEIHRFNKAQQDGFLPLMEDGTIVLVGATTENPSFELNAALLSRAQVLMLNRLTLADLERLLQRAEKEMGRPCRSSPRRARRSLRWRTGTGGRSSTSWSRWRGGRLRRRSTQGRCRSGSGGGRRTTTSQGTGTTT
jgi:Holliday junction resolvasome RuvABC ATP-dependent DNA helicase subunit